MRPRQGRERRQGRSRVIALAMGVHDLWVVPRLPRQEFVDQPRLAAAGIAHQHDAAAMPGGAAVQRLLQQRDLPGAADEGRVAAPGGHLEPRAPRVGGDQAIDLDRLAGAAQVEQPRRVGRDIAFDQPVGGGGDPRLAGFRRLFDAGGDVDHGAGGVEPGGEVVGDVMHHDLARMDADAGGQIDAVADPLIPRNGAQRVAHVQGRAAGVERMLFHRHRRAEHRHHAVAEHAVDRAPRTGGPRRPWLRSRA
jgi:hypothetical protein